MRRILIATHGYFANGIKSSMELLAGKQDSISYLNAYVDQRDITEDIKKFMNSVAKDDEAVIFTDLYGGSVNQKVIMLLPEDKKVYLITGFNLPVVLGVLLYSEPLTETAIHRMINESRIQLLDIQSKRNEEKVKKKKEKEEECDEFLMLNS